MFKPTRSERYIGETQEWEVTITPPTLPMFGLFEQKPVYVYLTENQYRRYRYWEMWGCPVQDVLPDLTTTQRECLISGIGPQEWDEFIGGNDA